MANKKNTKVNAENTTIVKEEATMAENTTINTQAEAIEEVAAAPAYPKDVVLFTASRGNNKALNWYNITVNEGDATTKIKGCAAELPVQVAEAVGTNKFIALVDKAVIERCVEEGKGVRGTASTFSDIYNRYTKVEDVKGDKTEIVIGIFKGILEAIANGTNEGAWVRPEPEKKEEAPEATAEEEAPTAEAEVEDPFEVAEG